MSPADDDGGAIAGFEALAFGALLFVAGTLLIVNAWGVVDAKAAVSAAAREATRAFVESPSDVTLDQAQARAHAAALAAVAGHGKGGIPDVTVTMAGATLGGGLLRCAAVTATVGYAVPRLVLPFVGAVGTGAFDVRATYTEIVDPYRSGLPAAGGACAP